jgi:LAO/AO transport system kinase
VLAVDPSSPFSGGALLGDRVRMQDHVLDDGVFIRSMASRGHLGGLSWAAPQALLVLDAAGFDLVVVETVGVGQAEVEIASLADTTLVVLAPGMGDAIQAAKAGILEVADVFCVNKADRDGTERTIRELKEMQHLGAGPGGDGSRGGANPHAGRQVPVLATVASTGQGIPELADAIVEHVRWLDQEGLRDERRLERARMQLRELALGIVRKQFTSLDEGDVAEELAVRIARRELDPYSAADQLVATL